MEQIEQVNLVLKEIGADHIPQILVWNKIDAAGLEPSVERDEYATISRVFVSAQKGSGLGLLRDAIVEMARKAPRSAHLYQNDEAPQEDQLDGQYDQHDGAAPDQDEEPGEDDRISTHSQVGTR